jgi:DNA-binding NtrC family response regulator
VKNRRVLVVDDEPGIRRAIGRYLESNGYVVDAAESCAAAEAFFAANPPDVALLDYKLPDGSGLRVLQRLAEACPGVPSIMLTAHGSIELAVEAIKEGAEHFLTKPVDLPALLLLVERLLESQRTRRRSLAGGRRLPSGPPDPFLGESAAIRALAAECEAIVGTDSSVLILGETGAGKGVLARWIHESGPRREEAFVDLNCAGLSRDLLESELFGHEAGAFTGATAAKMGLFEIAHRGTVFLDEVGDMDLQVQPKLLKVLEEKRFRRLGDVRNRHVDVRLVAATHEDLDRLVREGQFRQDLYFRINMFPIRVPPLRERREDIPLLARQLAAQLAAELGRGAVRLSEAAIHALQAHDWPGNVRELRNVLERALLLSKDSALEAGQLRFATAPGEAGDALSLDHAERQAIERALREERWRVAEAARRLGISKTTLYQKIKQYGLRAPAD